MTATSTTPGPTIRLDVVDGGVALLTLDNAAKLNALTSEMVDELLPAHCAAIAADDGIRAVVLTGAGSGFCSGADRDEHLSRLAAQGRGALGRPLGAFVLPVARLDKPVVAAINGTTAGGGLGLALSCDLRVASTTARFVAAYAAAGLVPDAGSSLLLPELIGRPAATRFLLAGVPMDAGDAHRLGLVDDVVEPDDLLATAVTLAASLATAPPAVVRRTKRLVTRDVLARLEAAIEAESELQWACLEERGGEP